MTSKPIVVKDIWGLYGRQNKSFMMSTGFQVAVVVILFTALSNKTVQENVNQTVSLVLPMDPLNPVAPMNKEVMKGGGGGGERAPLPASKEQTSQGGREAVRSTASSHQQHERQDDHGAFDSGSAR